MIRRCRLLFCLLELPDFVRVRLFDGKLEACWTTWIAVARFFTWVHLVLEIKRKSSLYQFSYSFGGPEKITKLTYVYRFLLFSSILLLQFSKQLLCLEQPCLSLALSFLFYNSWKGPLSISFNNENKYQNSTNTPLIRYFDSQSIPDTLQPQSIDNLPRLGEQVLRWQGRIATKSAKGGVFRT